MTDDRNFGIYHLSTSLIESMLINTPRLILREIDSAIDSEFINQLLNSAGFLKYIGDRGVRTQAEAAEFITHRYQQSYKVNGFGLYTVTLKTESVGEKTLVPIGICGFVKRETLELPDLGFALLPQFEGNGYAFEAAEHCLKYGAETLGLKEVYAVAVPENSKSHKLLGRLGFSKKRTIPDPNQDGTLTLFHLTVNAV